MDCWIPSHLKGETTWHLSSGAHGGKKVRPASTNRRPIFSFRTSGSASSCREARGCSCRCVERASVSAGEVGGPALLGPRAGGSSALPRGVYHRVFIAREPACGKSAISREVHHRADIGRVSVGAELTLGAGGYRSASAKVPSVGESASRLSAANTARRADDAVSRVLKRPMR